jgi:hypothetical protein
VLGVAQHRLLSPLPSVPDTTRNQQAPHSRARGPPAAPPAAPPARELGQGAHRGARARQVIRPALLRDGFALVGRERLAVTDDVSIVEALGAPVRLTAGSYRNIKVTTPDDMVVAEGFLRERRGSGERALAAAAA